MKYLRITHEECKELIKNHKGFKGYLGEHLIVVDKVPGKNFLVFRLIEHISTNTIIEVDRYIYNFQEEKQETLVNTHQGLRESWLGINYRYNPLNKDLLVDLESLTIDSRGNLEEIHIPSKGKLLFSTICFLLLPEIWENLERLRISEVESLKKIPGIRKKLTEASSLEELLDSKEEKINWKTDDVLWSQEDTDYEGISKYYSADVVRVEVKRKTDGVLMEIAEVDTRTGYIYKCLGVNNRMTPEHDNILGFIKKIWKKKKNQN